jgi:hypothetical protein
MSPLNAYRTTMAISALSVACTILNIRADATMHKLDKIAILIFTFVGAALTHLFHNAVQSNRVFTTNDNTGYNHMTNAISVYFAIGTFFIRKFPGPSDSSFVAHSVGLNLGISLMNGYEHYQFTKHHLYVRQEGLV